MRTMKKLGATMSLALLAFLSSCSKEDCACDANQNQGDNNTVKLDGIVGEWSVSDYSTKMNSLRVLKEDTMTYTSNLTATKFNDTKLFFVDKPSKLISEGSYDFKVTMVYNGQTNEVEEKDRPFSLSGDWEKIEDKKYKLESYQGEYILNLTENSDKEIVLEGVSEMEEKTDSSYYKSTSNIKLVLKK